MPEEDLASKIEVQNTRPDFYAYPTDFTPFLVEVESFEKPGPLRTITARVFWAGPELFLTRLRTAVRHADNQLKPYRQHGIPMLVVLDNVRRVGIPLAAIDLVNLFGIQEIHQPFDPTTGQLVGTPYLKGSDESFHVLTPNKNPYISGIAVNIPKEGHQYLQPPERERPMRLRIVHSPYACVDLPVKIFTDPEDEHIAVRDERWVNLQTMKPIFGH